MSDLVVAGFQGLLLISTFRSDHGPFPILLKGMSGWLLYKFLYEKKLCLSAYC